MNGTLTKRPLEGDHADEPELVALVEVNAIVAEPEEKRIKLEDDDVVGLDSAADDNTAIVPVRDPDLFYTPLRTGLVYDVRMRYHAKIFTLYFEYIDPHPEDPRRIYRIYKRLAEAGLITDPKLAGIDDIGPLMVKIPVREALADEILQVHLEDHLKYIALTELMTRDQLLEETERGDSIYVNNDSYILAKLSCGGTIEACKAVIEGRVKNLLAIVRPPGHHAEPETPGGFCLFSNVAVAAKNMLSRFPELVRRIVIVDWDIHHGNGTQKLFWDDPRVLYISLHRYENGKFYPGTKYGGADMVGEGAGEGYSLNIPWNQAGMTDADYVYAFNRVIVPVIGEFDPDLIIVLLGFDAADGDIIGGCHVTPTGYGAMTHMLKGLARGKIAVILEGGYNLESIAKLALGVAKVLVGEPPDNTISTQPSADAVEVVDMVMKIQLKYWKCLRHGIPDHSFDDVFDVGVENAGETNVNQTAPPLNVADSVRRSQHFDLSQRYGFVSVPIVANLAVDEIGKGFFTCDLPTNLDEVVLATKNVYDSEILVVNIHDPPEVWANINPVNGTIEPNLLVVLLYPMTTLIDRVNKEVEPSLALTVGYIDIDIPLFPVTLPGPLGALTQASMLTYNPQVFALDLLVYLWDNFFAYFGLLKKLVFVGYGDCYQLIVHLYGKRPLLEIKDLVRATVAFVNRTPLKLLVPVMDELLTEWFYQNSVIFTLSQNPCWQLTKDTEEKRPRRRFGRVLKLKSDGLFDVVTEKFDEGCDFLLDAIEE